VPWEKSPSAKSDTSKLLDILTGIPAVIGEVIDVMADRLRWLIGGRDDDRQENPSTVSDLRKRVEVIAGELALWRSGWETQNPVVAPAIFEWAFHRAHGDAYRPGIGGIQGPDIFDSNIYDTAAALNDSWPPLSTGSHLDPAADFGVDEAVIFTAMQDAALYTTILVWTTRLNRYLDGAARSPEAVDFYNSPFHTNCTCCSLKPATCETTPPDPVALSVDPEMSCERDPDCQPCFAF